MTDCDSQPTVARKGHWIAGRSVSPDGGCYFTSYNPVNDTPIASIAAGNEADVARAVAAADAASRSSRLGVREREAVLSAAASLLERDRAPLTELLVDEIGSPVSKAHFEIQMAIDAMRAAAGAARRGGGQTFPSDASSRFSMSIRQPVGVVASITPFNVPLLIGVKASSMALATGNSVVTLPSEDAPLIALRLAEIYAEAGLPDGLFNVVTGSGAAIGDALTGDRRVGAVLFTGSSAVGKHIGALCGAQLKPAILELGGKSPLIVLDDADVDEAVAGAILGIFLYQGQVCMGSSRVFVEAAVFDRFAEAFANAAEALACGDLRDPATMIGPIINPRQRARVRAHVADALDKGAGLRTGGAWRGNVCAPTLLEGVVPGMTVFDEETFGPVAQLHRIESLDQAIAMANASRYGLSAAIYTRDLTKALRFAHEVRSGMVHINAPTVLDEPHVPFGGVGDSGLGRTGTEESLGALTQVKWVTAQM